MLICRCIARVPYSNSPMILLLRYSYLSKQFQPWRMPFIGSATFSISAGPDAAGVPARHAAAPTARRRSTGNSGDTPPPPPPSPPSPSLSSSSPRTIDRAGRHVVGRPRRCIDCQRKSTRRGARLGDSRPPPPPPGTGSICLSNSYS